MNYKQLLNYLLTVTLLLGALTIVRAQEMDAPDTNPPGENVVLQWNRVLQETIATPGQHPATIFQTRPYAMMHAAIYDAVNSIDGTHTPYIANVPRSGNPLASQDAAAAQAAHDVLVALYPTRASVFAAELNTSLNGIPGFRAFLGVRVGRIAAAQLLAVRAKRRLAGHAAAVRFADDSGKLATRAGQYRCDIYALSGRSAVCDWFRHTIHAESAARVDERRIRA
jgi:hypothetical protein